MQRRSLPSCRTSEGSRALSGSQESGDGYVVQTLEAIIADQGVFDTRLPTRVALYRTFLQVWNTLPLNKQTDKSVAGPSALAERRLEQITPLPRQAFLLTSVEEFSPRDVAIIIGRPERDVLQLIDDASREISSHIAARVMIIEDEPLIALDIETLVGEIGHTSVGIAATRDQATELAARTKPDIILSDIQLADGSSGIDAVTDILKDLNVPVIYITAYPERLLTGARQEPAFLITKPFQPSMVKAMVSQALFFGVE